MLFETQFQNTSISKSVLLYACLILGIRSLWYKDSTDSWAVKLSLKVFLEYCTKNNISVYNYSHMPILLFMLSHLPFFDSLRMASNSFCLAFDFLAICLNSNRFAKSCKSSILVFLGTLKIISLLVYSIVILNYL